MSTAQNPKIGLDHVVIAPLISDNPGSVMPIYGTPIALPGAVQATVNPNSDVSTDYADNGAFFVVNNRGNIEMSLEFTNIHPEILAQMLGQKRQNGITIEKVQDQSPYFAMGFRVWVGGVDDNGNKIYELFWYAKGKFSVPESGGTTKKDSIEFQHTSLTAQFVSTQASEGGNGDGIFCSHCRTDIETNSEIVSNWFNAPILTASVDVNAVTVTATENDGTVVITGSKVGGGSFTFNESTLKLGENVLVMEDGNIVNGTIEISSPSASPTITFTPSTEMTGDVSVIVTSGLKDTNGVGVTPYSITL